MTKSALHVARYVVEKSGSISNLKLQKLLYYVQGWHLALRGKPLFGEDIEAWVHGPVVPSVFREYRGFGWQNVKNTSKEYTLSLTDTLHIDSVLRVYGKYTGAQLVRLSHSEEPWKKARPNLAPDEASKAVITHKSMREFFASRSQA